MPFSNHDCIHGCHVLIRAIFKYRPYTSSSVLPHAGVIFLQVSPIKSPRKAFSLHGLHHIRITEDNIDEVTDKRLKALKEIEKDKLWVARAYNKKVKIKSF